MTTLTTQSLKLSESVENISVQIVCKEKRFERLAVLFHLFVMLSHKQKNTLNRVTGKGIN